MLRRAPWIVSLCLICTPPVHSQRASPGPDLLAPLRRGSLVLWIVTPDPDPVRRALQRAYAAPVLPGYQEQTSGSFGQNAGTYGRTAGSVGQTVATFGQLSSEGAQTAGTYGQTSGTFGQTAGSVGQNAGDAGQTVASFGVSSTNLPDAATAANGSHRVPRVQLRDRSWLRLESSLHLYFPGLTPTFVDVFDTDLQDRLASVAGTADAPDLLLWSPVQTPRLKLNRAQLFPLLVSTIWTTSRIPQSIETEPREMGVAPSTALVLSAARNPEAARAFYLWMTDGGVAPSLSAANPEAAQAGAVAASAMRSLLQTGSIGGEADPEMAGYRQARSGSAAALTALRISAERTVEAEPVAISVNGSLAVVSVRAIGSAPKEFGILHAVFVLRKDSAAHWRILQVSPDLTTSQQRTAFDFLASARQSASTLAAGDGAHPKGISQASPLNGDKRTSQPDLWWDNLGGATLQVVEWQAGPDPSVTSNLFFVPDNASRLQTRVTARFAAQPNLYRWRVWSVGADVTIVLSPWRTLNIVDR